MRRHCGQAQEEGVAVATKRRPKRRDARPKHIIGKTCTRSRRLKASGLSSLPNSVKSASWPKTHMPPMDPSKASKSFAAMVRAMTTPRTRARSCGWTEGSDPIPIRPIQPSVLSLAKLCAAAPSAKAKKAASSGAFVKSWRPHNSTLPRIERKMPPM